MEPFYFHRGFSLVELTVVLAIIATISTMVITSQSAFNKTLTLSNTAYDIALTLRSAQTFGLSTRASESSTNAGYGIHLQSGLQNTFTLFRDISPTAESRGCTRPDCLSGDRVYTEFADFIEQTYQIENGMLIRDFCALSGTTWACAFSGALTALDIVFERPNPNVYMTARNGSVLFSATEICLAISSPQGGSRFITVGAAGQIIANAASNPDSCHE